MDNPPKVLVGCRAANLLPEPTSNRALWNSGFADHSQHLKDKWEQSRNAAVCVSKDDQNLKHLARIIVVKGFEGEKKKKRHE